MLTTIDQEVQYYLDLLTCNQPKSMYQQESKLPAMNV